MDMTAICRADHKGQMLMLSATIATVMTEKGVWFFYIRCFFIYLIVST